MYVSLGNTTSVPDVYLKSLDEASRLLEAANLVPSSNYQSRDKLGALYDQVAPNTVVSNEPRGGAEVACGTEVILGVREP
jgi:beta-lactam-binding protein with PASTA domain